MRQVTLPTYPISAFDSTGITMVGAAILDETSKVRVHLATFEPGAVLGSHPAHLRQQFTVLDGAGWVRTDGVRESIAVGDTVEWLPGDVHESGSDTGMRVLIIESDGFNSA